MTGTTTVPTGDAELRAYLLAQVDAIADTLASCADEAEKAGRYPEAGWRALHDAGLFRMKAPRELGGAEADPVTQIEVIEKVAYIDTTAAWTMFVGAGTLAVASAWLPDAAMDVYLVDGRLPRTAGGIAATGAAVPVEGGYRVTARWSFGSGCYHAEWLSGNTFVADADPPQVLGVVFPVGSATIHDTWDVSSLKGTGSADIAVDDLFVPIEHTFDNFSPAARGGPLYTIALPGLVANEHGAFALGAARRALDETAELAKTKTRGYVVPQGTAARQKFQWDLGRADAALHAAHAGLVAVNEEVWRVATSGTPVDVDLQTRLRAAAVHATEVALDTARAMFRYAGAKSLYSGNVIDRCLRDIQAAAQHGIVADVSYELRGQAILGLQDIAPLS